MHTRFMLSLVVLCGACGQTSSGPSHRPSAGQAPQASSSGVAEPGATSRDMLQHFVRVAALERAVIDDDLDEVRKQARDLIKQRTGDPASWSPYVGYLRRAAESVLHAPNMDQAAVATATVVGQCGRCHVALGVTLNKTKAEDPPPNATVAQKMRRHQWATGILRTAIVFSSGALWLRGAQALSASPLHTSEVDGGSAPDSAVAEHVRILRQLGTLAVGAKPDERQGTYGAILRTCVKCHVKVR